MKYTLLFSLTAIYSIVFSQIEPFQHKEKKKFYFHWGYNRANFTNSNLHFKGEEYDFTLHKVKAKDRQSDIDIRYLDPTKLSIPQYNYRGGFYINDKWSISLGWDHMKYVMVSVQPVHVDGYVNNSYDSLYGGKYDDSTIVIDRDFLTFEHTDGLNYISAQVERNFELWKSRNEQFSLSNAVGLGAGVLIPRSDVELMHNDVHDEWHLAGYGLSLVTNVRFTFLKNWYLEYNLKGGFINMTDVRTTPNKSDRANHNFLFLERFCVLGVTFQI